MRLPQRLLAFFLSFALIFSSTSALATTSVGGWSAVDVITAGATNTINAVKGAGATGMRSAVAVAPSAVKVGKHLIKGGGAAALAFAMVELADGALDWVLDPANNRVQYTASSGLSYPATAYRCLYGQNRVGDPEKICAGNGGRPWTGFTNSDGAGGGSPTCGGTIVSPSFKCTLISGSTPLPSETKYIPIDTVAAKVIANAEAGHADSQEAVKAVALEGFAAGEHDAALDAAAVPDTGVENPTDPTDPPKDPAVPFDPSSIIAAINALKALLAGILSSITSLADWFKADPEQKDNEVDIPDVPLPEPNTDISFGGSCPADLSVNFNLYGTSTDFVLMPFSKFCPLLSTFVKPTLIVLGSFFAVSIVGGRRDE